MQYILGFLKKNEEKGPIDLHILHEIKCYLNMAQIEVTINNVIFWTDYLGVFKKC